MTGPQSTQPVFYRPSEVAVMLRCSEWWVKEQARQRRIPYAWIGGSYLFTAEHIAEIVRRFEVHPIDVGLDQVGRYSATSRRKPDADPPAGPAAALIARVPRRMRQADANAQPAA